MEQTIQTDATVLAQLCQNSRCGRSHSGLGSSFCPNQRACIHALDSYRQAAGRFASTPYTAAFTLTHAKSSSIGTPRKYHTSSLIRCGIDPWSPTDEIKMRHQFCQALVAILDQYLPGPASNSNSNSNVDYAWSIENMTYRMSHPHEYCDQHQVKQLQKLDASAARSFLTLDSALLYQLLCQALLSRMLTDAKLVNIVLLSGSMQPAEFYRQTLG